ncbi:MAG: hypothetical protein WC412_04840 [Candidatus Omnitrophota bacterium]|jgi:desulfoferrodoxin (superoxide reductase-like protein)
MSAALVFAMPKPRALARGVMEGFILFFIFSFLYVFEAFGHPPQKIDITQSDKTINIVVTHNVKDPATHYIKLIEVVLNGKKIIDQEFSLQTANFQKATYSIPDLKKGDILEVDADCNQFGDLKEKIKIE